MEEQSASNKKKVTSWEELIEELVKPARYPRFPELTSDGYWKPWSADAPPQLSITSNVEQPTRVPSRLLRLVSSDRQYCRPLRFKPLPEGHIRLLDLHDAKIRDNVLVGFKLITTQLSTAPEYEAISYCWGSTDFCTGIFVSSRYHNKQVYRVTENLATCLHSLVVSHKSDTDRPRYIWVDQICINQEDVIERNVQVRRMSEIYRTAAGVIVWLGQESNFNLDDFDLDVSPDPHMIWRGHPVIDWTVDWAIFGRPWFYRLWVFQEAVFAQRVTILLGTGSMSWEAVFERSLSLAEFQADRRKRKVADSYVIPTILSYEIVAIINLTTRDLADGTTVDLASLMWQLYHQKCQDSRDRIYSLVGFAGNALPVDFVDYDQSIEAVIQKCTRHLIETSGSLEAITYSNPEIPQRRPSWVPLWHESLRGGLGILIDASSASLRRKWKPVLPLVDDQLIVSGRVVDSISIEVESFHDSMKRYFIDSKLTSVLRAPFYEAWNQTNHEYIANGQREPMEDVASDSDSSAFPPGLSSEPAQEFFKSFFRTIFIGEDAVTTDCETLIQIPEEETALARLEDLLSWSPHYPGVLFVLESGRLGFVEHLGERPKAGDSIAILHGHKLPCILRKAEDGEGWLYITEIYIHDIMNGEAVDWEEDEADTFTLV